MKTSSETSSRRSRFTIRAAFLAILLAGALAAWWILAVPGPELLWEEDQPIPHAHIWNGELYTGSAAQSLLRIDSRNLGTGKVRTVASIRLPGRSISQFSFQDGTAHFTATPSPNRQAGIQGGGAAGGPGKKYLGEFLHKHDRPFLPGEKRFTTYIARPALTKGELIVVSLVDGKQRAVGADVQRLPIDQISKVLTPETLYWVKNTDRRYVSVSTDREQWLERPQTGAVMASPLHGGPPQKIAMGARYIGGSREAIWWQSLRPYPDDTTDLHYFIPETRERGSIRHFSTNSFNQQVHLVGYRNRIYWLSPPESDGSSALLRANPHSTAPEVVVRFPPGSWVSQHILAKTDGELWTVKKAASPNVVTPASPPGAIYVGSQSEAAVVIVIDPPNRRVSRQSRPLQGSRFSIHHVENDFAYYTAHETKRHLLDFLSPEDTMRSVHCLYRTRLNSVK